MFLNETLKSKIYAVIRVIGKNSYIQLWKILDYRFQGEHI